MRTICIVLRNLILTNRIQMMTMTISINFSERLYTCTLYKQFSLPKYVDIRRTHDHWFRKCPSEIQLCCRFNIIARQIFGQLVSSLFNRYVKCRCKNCASVVLRSGNHLSKTKHPACIACLRSRPRTLWDSLLETSSWKSWRKLRKKFSPCILEVKTLTNKDGCHRYFTRGVPRSSGNFGLAVVKQYAAWPDNIQEHSI